MKHTLIVKDDFCPHVSEVRESALQSGFGTWTPPKGKVGSSIYDGMNFQGKHDLMIGSLCAALGGRPIFPHSMFFRVTTPETEAAYTHSDRHMGDWTCVAYLSEHEERCGTAFYRHRETGLLEMPRFEDMEGKPEFDKLKHDMIYGGENEWEEIDFIRAVYNRAVIFHAPLFHARVPKHGIGHKPEEARMIWASHFFLAV